MSKVNFITFTPQHSNSSYLSSFSWEQYHFLKELGFRLESSASSICCQSFGFPSALPPPIGRIFSIPYSATMVQTPYLVSHCPAIFHKPTHPTLPQNPFDNHFNVNQVKYKPLYLGPSHISWESSTSHYCPIRTILSTIPTIVQLGLIHSRLLWLLQASYLKRPLPIPPTVSLLHETLPDPLPAGPDLSIHYTAATYIFLVPLLVGKFLEGKVDLTHCFTQLKHLAYSLAHSKPSVNVFSMKKINVHDMRNHKIFVTLFISIPALCELGFVNDCSFALIRLLHTVFFLYCYFNI